MRRGFALCAVLVSCSGKTSAPQATPAPSDSTSSTSPPALDVFAKFRVNTDPDGATVKEDGYEVCNSTPCEVTYRGAIDADLAKDHKLLISKTGYKVESKTVRIGDSPITVKLTRAPAQRTPPPPPQQPGKSNDEWQHYQ